MSTQKCQQGPLGMSFLQEHTCLLSDFHLLPNTVMYVSSSVDSQMRSDIFRGLIPGIVLYGAIN